MADNSTGTARKRGPGRPFPKGVSGNPGGRRKSLLSDAMTKRLTPESAEQIMGQVVAAAGKGEPWAIAMLWDRSEGKAIGRNESGAPGEFTGLEDKPIAELIELAQRRA